MPKSKRAKQISLTKTRKNCLERKQTLVEKVRENVDNYARIFVLNVDNMRNSKIKIVRQEWKHSRFFFGKNKVMALALGRESSDEYQENLHKLSKHLKGQCGLLFTNGSRDEVVKYFSGYSDSDFARSGNTATETVTLDKGPLPQFSHALEPHLRKLGLPTSLQKGIITLIKDHTVCKEGETLTPEQCRILKLLGTQMAEFKVRLVCMWSNDGTFEVLQSSDGEGNDDGSDGEGNNDGSDGEGNDGAEDAGSDDEDEDIESD